MMWFSERARRGRRRKAAAVEDLRTILAVRGTASRRRRLRRQWISFAILLSVVLAGTAWAILSGVELAGRKLFSENDLFAIRHLEISSDGRLKPWHIREYADLHEGLNLFGVDIERIRSTLESVPVVDAVEVERRLPDTLRIHVTERVALARIPVRRRRFFMGVDREGYVLGPVGRGKILPVLRGVRTRGLRPGDVLATPVLRDALYVLDLCETTRLSNYIHIGEMDVSDENVLDLRLDEGTRVLLKRSDLEWRLRKLAALMQHYKQRGWYPAMVDATGDINFTARGRI